MFRERVIPTRGKVIVILGLSLFLGLVVTGMVSGIGTLVLLFTDVSWTFPDPALIVRLVALLCGIAVSALAAFVMIVFSTQPAYE